jgi:hypothetical protein
LYEIDQRELDGDERERQEEETPVARKCEPERGEREAAEGRGEWEEPPGVNERVGGECGADCERREGR